MLPDKYQVISKIFLSNFTSLPNTFHASAIFAFACNAIAILYFLFSFLSLFLDGLV